MNIRQMKKIVAIYIIISISICSYGQNDSLQQTSNADVTYYLVIDKRTVIPLDSLSKDAITPKWIKKVVNVKDEKYRYVFGNTGGKLLMYPKKRYKKKLLENLHQLSKK